MNLRDQLKKQTSSLHEKAEAATNTHASVDSITGYSNFLRGMYFIYSKYSQALDQSSLLLGLEARSSDVLRNLKLDLKSLGCEDSLLQKEVITDEFENNALLGIAYVFEGSALGSGILLKKVNNNFKEMNLSHNYLKFMCKDMGHRWPTTIKKLSQYSNVEQNSINHACEVFQTVTKTMESMNAKI